jgi:hypothetical protein
MRFGGSMARWATVMLLLLGCRAEPVGSPTPSLVVVQPSRIVVLQSENPNRVVSEPFAIENSSSDSSTWQFQNASCGCTSVHWTEQKLVKEDVIPVLPQLKMESVLVWVSMT